MNRERLKGNLDLLLLSVLAAGPAHGYAIISALRSRSAGTFDLPEGTVYPALHRLEDAGLLARSWADADGHGGGVSTGSPTRAPPRSPPRRPSGNSSLPASRPCWDGPHK
jgi:hypothetical protein